MTTLAEFFGETPARVVWKVVSGDSSSIQIDFLENDESTGFDCDGWDYSAVAYDPKLDEEYDLEIESEGHSVVVKASADLTTEWISAELLFDLQVDTGTEIWTPVVGTITVLDRFGGSL